MRIIGIDFSAARDASRKIWLAFGNAVNDQLHIETLAPLETLADRPLANASPVLARIIASSGPSIIACDACFGLPVPSSAAPWHTWLLSYPSRFADAEQLRQEGRDAHGRERKRLTDRVARAPFAPTNLRIYRQTDSWLRSVLHPLVAADAVAVAPLNDCGKTVRVFSKFVLACPSANSVCPIFGTRAPIISDASVDATSSQDSLGSGSICQAPLRAVHWTIRAAMRWTP